MVDLRKFAENLNDLMFDYKISQKELAERTGIDKASINRYLKGNCMPSVKSVVKLADFFNCSVDFLLGLSEEKSNTEFLPCPPISERINYFLELSELTAYRFCKNVKLPDSRFYHWQKGTHSPTIPSIENIANYFKCSIDKVLGRES